MSLIKTAILVSSAIALSACSGTEVMDTKSLQKDIVTASGDVLGKISLKDLGAGGTEVTVTVSGLQQAGTHAMHFHEIGMCEAPGFTSSGGHYNPTNMDHGKMSANGPHAGDMMNLEVGEDGTGTLTVVNDRVSIQGDNGLPALYDADGSALIIHERADDYVTQPTGAAGARIGCAELK